jgi:hypothetical protein
MVRFRIRHSFSGGFTNCAGACKAKGTTAHREVPQDFHSHDDDCGWKGLRNDFGCNLRPEADAEGKAEVMREASEAEKANNMNISRIRMLADDAKKKGDQAHDAYDAESEAYWHGFADGLKRAIGVLEGRG